jgi:hypothetical protein
MNKLTMGFAACGVAAAAGLSLAACSSGGSSSSSSSSSSSNSGPVTGTETFNGTEHLTAAETASTNYNPTVPLTASGMFSDTGSIYLSGGNGAGSATIALKNGDIKVQHAKTNPNLQPKSTGVGCTYAATQAVNYTVTGGTGSYSNVTGGKGVATVIFGFTLPKLSNGSCNTSSSATPTAGYATFHAIGSLTRSS